MNIVQLVHSIVENRLSGEEAIALVQKMPATLTPDEHRSLLNVLTFQHSPRKTNALLLSMPDIDNTLNRWD